VTAIEQQWCSSPHRANVTSDAVAMAVFPAGPKALNTMRAGLPTDFPASVLVVPRLCLDRHLLARPDATVSQATRVQFVRPLCDISRALWTVAATLGGW
jgi:hypothetical protein